MHVPLPTSRKLRNNKIHYFSARSISLTSTVSRRPLLRITTGWRYVPQVLIGCRGGRSPNCGYVCHFSYALCTIPAIDIQVEMDALDVRRRTRSQVIETRAGSRIGLAIIDFGSETVRTKEIGLRCVNQIGRCATQKAIRRSFHSDKSQRGIFRIRAFQHNGNRGVTSLLQWHGPEV